MTDTLITLEAGTEVSVTPLNSNFTYLDNRITSVNTTVNTNTSSISTLSNSVSSLQNPAVISLSGTSVALTDNSEHKITISGNTTFTHPVASDGTKFHQALVFVHMPTVYSINLGTDGNYFYNMAPDMSEAGDYTVIYEYDNNTNTWYAGAIFRG